MVVIHMKNEPKVYIVILNYNGLEDTLECLDSLCDLDYKNYSIIVCDNASINDPEFEINKWKLKHNKQDVHYIQTGINLGFAGGNNVGLRYAMAKKDFEYAWVLNNDTVLRCDALPNLVSTMQQNKSIGICGSKLIYYFDKSTVQGYGGKYNSYLGFPTVIRNIEDIDSIDYPIGASMFISKSFLTDVGLMCEDYFLYFEELDWSLRAKKKGYSISCAVDSVVYHKEGRSIGSHSNLKKKSNFADYYLQRNKIIITKKFYSKKMATLLIGMLVGVVRRILLGEYKKAYQQLKIMLYGVIEKN